MNSATDLTEVPPRWRVLLREQGRNLSWLATVTGKTYPQVTAYAQGRTKVPPDWERKVYELLGEAS